MLVRQLPTALPVCVRQDYLGVDDEQMDYTYGIDLVCVRRNLSSLFRILSDT